MLTKGIFATLVAKEGKELEVEEFLRSAKNLIDQESGTRTWYAIKLSTTRYGIFDTFDDDSGRLVHLHGKVAAALMEQAPHLFESTPIIEPVDILTSTSK